MTIPIDEIVASLKSTFTTPRRASRGIPTAASAFRQTEDGYCIEITVRPVQWCDEHKMHLPIKRRKKKVKPDDNVSTG